MIFSLPNYRRFAEASLQRMRKDGGRPPTNRLGDMLFNLVIIAALWGVVLYARWVVLSDVTATALAVIGKWRNDDRFLLEFTANQQVRLLSEGTMIESAEYRIFGDILVISDFKLQPGERELMVNPQCYQITMRGHQLTVTPADNGFTPVSDHAAEERSQLHLLMPPWRGSSVQLRRDHPR